MCTELKLGGKRGRGGSGAKNALGGKFPLTRNVKEEATLSEIARKHRRVKRKISLEQENTP